ncbi:hypothetical protein [Candidatus Bandiella euplotis]|uniref:RDD family protein n=1 Tax=Candidatus Bandiella euplotis TaxID=1664265 RepID=A0ABZ0UNC9_9RICK|nr:hypothetical protein [Candidatus Bandiella woodruffii]WPX96345.1 hypothetical protein Bandiella_00454 [Candidatus Bandiella woodruffii]
MNRILERELAVTLNKMKYSGLLQRIVAWIIDGITCIAISYLAFVLMALSHL